MRKSEQSHIGSSALQGAKKMGLNALSRVLSRTQPSMDPETFTTKYLYVPIDPNDKKAAEAAKLVNDDFIEKKAAAESVKHDILSPEEFKYNQAREDFMEAYRLAKSAHSAQGIHRKLVKIPIKTVWSGTHFSVVPEIVQNWSMTPGRYLRESVKHSVKKVLGLNQNGGGRRRSKKATRRHSKKKGTRSCKA
jgi:hypothetical protein